MTEEEIKEKFYKTFDIKPQPYCSYHNCRCPKEDVGRFNKYCPMQAVAETCQARIENYMPEITDHILLELICLFFKYRSECSCCYADNFKTLKKLILQYSAEDWGYLKEEYKREVRKLFENKE